MSKNKNVSKIYKTGTKVQTRDEYLDKNKYQKNNHPNKNDLYRGTYIIATNSKNELVLVKETTHGGKCPKGTLSDYVNVFDCNGNPIKIDGKRFVLKKRKIIKHNELVQACQTLFINGKRSKKNRRLVHKHVKGRQ